MTIEEFIIGKAIVNVGGGLAIKYDKSEEDVPTTVDYIKCFQNFDLLKNVQLIFEPGRSLVGNSGMLAAKIIGVKFWD